MNRIHLSLTHALVATLTVASVAAAAIGFDGDEQKPAATQTSQGQAEHISVAFSDPSRPGKLNVHLLSGSVTIKGYEGKDVIVDARMAEDSDDKDNKPERSSGMHRIRASSSGLEIEEEHNAMVVRTGFSNNHPMRLTIQVP